MTERHESVRLEPDRLPGPRAFGWIAAAWVTMVLFTWWAWALHAGSIEELRPGRPGPRQPAEAPPAIANVNQWLFGLESPELELRRIQRERLSAHGWVDRDEGLVHLPIEDAFDVLLERERP